MTSKQRDELTAIIQAATRLDREQLGVWLLRRRFKELPVSIKHVFVGKSFVVKYDDTSNPLPSHTRGEYLSYQRVKRWKRRWLAKTLGFSNGVLIQEKVSVCPHQWRSSSGKCCEEAEVLARRLRILDWRNHGCRIDGSLVFYDFDSQGSGWWNWKRRSSKKGKAKNESKQTQ